MGTRWHTNLIFIGIAIAQVAWSTSAQQAGFAASITGLQPQAQTTYTWVITNTVDRPAVTLQVGDNNGWATVQYLITYSRTRNQQQAYVLTGSVSIRDTDGRGDVITVPTVTALTGRRKTVKLPPSSVICPSLTVPANGEITCTFTANYTGDQPLPGSVSATVANAGTSRIVRAPSVPYNFAGAAVAEVGGIATISSYFEAGSGLVQPYGVSGSQPPPGLTISDDTVYNFTAFYGNIPASSCGQQLQAVNTAQVTPAASGVTSGNSTPTTVASTVTIDLLGCEAAGGPAPAFASTPTAPASVPATPTSPAAPPAAPLAATVLGGAPPAGLTFAEAGSILCGSGVCAPGQRCFDGWNCCDQTVDICGGVCCDGGRLCVMNQCVQAGSTVCGTNVCPPGQACISGVCCPTTQVVCGGACCAAGQGCVSGQCAATGSAACGTNVCSPTQQCVGGSLCCNTGETACGNRCCTSGNICLGNQFCVPAGSTLCGGTVCQSPQQCAGGAVCCDVGATFCGTSCCPSGNTCQGTRCLPPGNSLCGNNVCTSSQTCQGNQVCCDQGASFCNNGCCAQGNACINNQCAPTGSTACGATVICPINQFCGNPTTGLCCQSTSQIGCFTSCCKAIQEVCNQLTQQCSSRFNQCPAGTVWCAAANTCCGVGQICVVGQCVTSNAVLGRRLMTA